MHTMYICDRCGWGHFHPLSYCQMCPGKLYPRKVPMPDYHRITPAQEEAHFAKLGIKYIGEYPASERKLAELRLARANEHYTAKLAEIETAKAAGDEDLARKARRSADFWLKTITQYQTELEQCSD